MKLLSNLSGLAQVLAMTYVAYRGTAPEWLRWCFAVFAALYVLLHVLAASG